jgi:ABC-type multidrug transport system fused ATPase/permease subunit
VQAFKPLRGHWPAILRLFGWSVVVAVATASYGLLVGPVLRALFGGESLVWPNLLAPHLPTPPTVETLRSTLPWLVVAVAALKGLAHHRQIVGTARLGQRVVLELRTRVYQRILAFPPDVARQMGLGVLSSHVINDTAAVERWLTQGRLRQIRDGVQLIALLAVCLTLEPRLALVTFGIYPLVFLPIAALGRRLRRAARQALEDQGHLQGAVTDDLAVLPALQLGGREAAATTRLTNIAQRLAQRHVRAASLGAAASPLTEIAGAGALGVTLAVATGWIAEGLVAPEQVLGFFVTLLLFYEPAKGLARAQEALAPGREALLRIHTLEALPERLPSGAEGLAPPTRPPLIEVRALAVERGGRAVLTDVKLRLAAGQITALVGPNGAGKTTLAWAIAGLVQPAAGEIRVNGAALDTMAPTPWRRSVGWVTADAGLGRGTVQAAVCDGRPASAAQLQAAADRSGLSEVLTRIGGWQAPLGDGGAGLSSGERQRVALARALLHQPCFLVLDEPTAHVDAEGRAALIARLPRLAETCTVLLVTHDARLSAVAHHTIHLAGGAVGA